jgi:hypothetical protein
LKMRANYLVTADLKISLVILFLLRICSDLLFSQGLLMKKI